MLEEMEAHTPFASRKKYNTTGQDIRVGVNQFRVTEFKTQDVGQFDVRGRNPKALA